MSTADFFRNMMETISRRRRAWFPDRQAPLALAADLRPDFAPLFDALLSGKGEASGVALARDILTAWAAVDDGRKQAFFTLLAEAYGPSTARLEKAIAAYQAAPGLRTEAALHRASEPRRQEVLRRLNLAPGGVATLVKMREYLLGIKKGDAALEALDADFAHLFASWFNRGFLVLERIDWSTPANILERIIHYEAVHQIHDWSDLRRRLAPPDRRLYAFFHPQLVDDPLIFVEVALAGAIPDNIHDVLTDSRDVVDPKAATTAVFYSISNCQEGLRGISFGNFLIKQVVEDLRRELPGIDTFVTLSPVPGLARWLKEMRADEGEASAFLSSADRMVLQALDRADWALSPALSESVNMVLARVAAHYMLRARTRDGRVIDPVARFHLGNGARLERINPFGDRSTNGMRQSHGVMVNYLYDLGDIEANHEALATRGEVIASPAVHALLAEPESAAPAPAGGRFRFGGFNRSRGEARPKEARS